MRLRGSRPLKKARRWSLRPVALIAVTGIAVVVILAVGVTVALKPETGTLTSGAAKFVQASASGGYAAPLGLSTATPTPTPSSTPTPTTTRTASHTPTPSPIATVRIWPIGDSITEGQNADQKNGYRLDLWNALTARGYKIDYVGDYNYGLAPLPDWDTNGDGGACILANPCYPSDILYNVTSRSMVKLNPDIVIMNGGANDFCCGNSQDPVRVENYMKQWIQLMWTIKPNAYLIVLGLTADYHVEYDNWVQQYVAQLAAQGKHIGYVFIEDVTTNDTVHPDNAGYQTITDRMIPIIKPMMQQLTGH